MNSNIKETLAMREIGKAVEAVRADDKKYGHSPLMLIADRLGTSTVRLYQCGRLTRVPEEEIIAQPSLTFRHWFAVDYCDAAQRSQWIARAAASEMTPHELEMAIKAAR